MNCEAGLLLNCENPTPGSHFCGESTLEQQMTARHCGAFESCPISAHYRTFIMQRQARRIWREKCVTKRRFGLGSTMVRFAPADALR